MSLLLILVRGAAFGVLAWTFAAAPVIWHSSELNAYAQQIQQGDNLKPALLEALRQTAKLGDRKYGDAQTLRSIALISVRLAEITLEHNDKADRRRQLAAAIKAVKAALASNPSDGFLWYALFWLEKAAYGFQPSNIRYLALSYVTSGHEGWIAVHRNRDALTVYNQLPDNLQAKTLDEFRNLVAANYTDDAVSILSGPGWPYRELLLASMRSLPEGPRHAFADRLTWRGINLQVPGVPLRRIHPFEFAPG